MPTTADAPSIVAPEKSARAASGLHEFREERWVELYAKKIEEMIGVLKSKGVPVLWVGLPAIRGVKGTSDMLFLNSLYRDGAGKAGITYVDVWDGFVDEAGRFLQKGPDFEGQIRQLRCADGVYFTKPGARKLAHYVDREITRLLGRHAPGRSRCRANRLRPTPMPLPASPRRGRWRDRSCRWWRPPSAPINCSAVPARARLRSMRSPRARWSRVKRWRRPPAAPTISSGRAAKSAANRPRATRRSPTSRRMDGGAQRPLTPLQQQQQLQQQLQQPATAEEAAAAPVQTQQPSMRDFFGGFGASRSPAPAPRQAAPPAAGPRVAPPPATCRARRPTSGDRPRCRRRRRVLSRDK